MTCMTCTYRPYEVILYYLFKLACNHNYLKTLTGLYGVLEGMTDTIRGYKCIVNGPKM